MKRFLKSVLPLLIICLGFISCVDDTKVLEASADAFIIKRLFNDEHHYAMSFQVTANKEIKSATATSPAQNTINLEVVPDFKFTFTKEPTLSDYSKNIPATGEYFFEIYSAEEELLQLTDNVEFEDLFIPEITNTEFNNTSKILSVSWNPVLNADGYAVKVARPNGDVIFISYSLDFDATEYQIGTTYGNWIQPPVVGSKYILEVHAFCYEDDIPNEEKAYNLKEIAIGEKEIYWGQ